MIPARCVYASEMEYRSPLTLLTREADRRLRAMAWRHIHRINPVIARRLWRKVRSR